MPLKDIEERKKYIKKWSLVNKDKRRISRKKSYHKNILKNKEKSKISRYKTHIKYKYGITQEIYNDLFLKQEGRCAICNKTSNRKLYIDHNHTTDKVRGLLCMKCNAGLGMFDDSIFYLINACSYLHADIDSAIHPLGNGIVSQNG